MNVTSEWLESHASIEPDAFTKSNAHFAHPSGSDLLARTEAFFAWQDARRRAGVLPYSRSLEAKPGPTSAVRADTGARVQGVNFASQDYLSLASHPSVADAARRALDEFGPHSAGSPCLVGNTRTSLELEQAIGEHVGLERVVLFPTGWAAAFGSVVALVRPDDHVVMDQLAHASLQQGAYAATRKVARHPHLDVDAVRTILAGIREKDARNGILVITEGLFSMDSDSPALAPLQEACHAFGATLLVDVAHDLGALGPRGTGRIGAEGLLGKIDLVMGSFSKTFASNGGFCAMRSEAVRQYMKWFGGPHTFSNALSPLQASVVREAFRIVRSPEGDALRERLMQNVLALRAAFARRGIRALGDPSAIVPVPIGSEPVARVASALAAERGVVTNLVEYPGVAVGAARFRMQVMAKHDREAIERAAELITGAIQDAVAIWDERGGAWRRSAAEGSPSVH